MEDELEILTEKQKKIYLLRSKGVPLKRIAEEMGITVSAVSRYFHIAIKKLDKYRDYQEQQKKNDIPVEILLTKRELLLIAEGLTLLDVTAKQRMRINTVCEKPFPILYEYRLIHTLIKRIEILLSGKE